MRSTGKQSERKTPLRRLYTLFLGSLLLVAGLAGCQDQVRYTPPPNIPVYPIMDVPEGDDVGDDEITAVIEGELRDATGVDANEVAVTTQAGVVTLTGNVSNILARERAERIAATIKGVRSVINQVAVSSSERTGEQIEADVRDALARDPVTEPWDITATAEPGIVTLTGTVESWHESQVAERVAKGVRGVMAVNNELSITYTTSRPDAEIREEVEAALRWNARIDDALLEVSVQEGEVALSGAVSSAHERTLAAATSWVNGVRSVDAGAVQVAWWLRDDMKRDAWAQERTDEEVRAAVVVALLYDPRVVSDDIDVQVENGLATLTGSVSTLKGKRTAAQDVSNTVGIWGVQNDLIVRSSVIRSDAEVAASVRSALQADSYVEKYEVEVNAEAGVVTLGGTVDSYFEKKQAEDVAARISGVVDVENEIVVDADLVTHNAYLYDWDPVDSDYDYLYVEKADEQLRSDIRTELFWSPYVDEEQVTVTVEDGTATLTGTVDTWYERATAMQEAYEGGALEVENNLSVAYGPERSDANPS